MSQLLRIIFAQECTSTHHKLAIDSLRFLELADADNWRNLFLYYFDSYLDGSKAPDTKFKDFKNHVLHVDEDFWGGAVDKAQEWYKRSLRLFRQGAWSQAVYAAGVLSHYFSDPFMPLHTGQSEEETQIHRAVEWSITKSYDELQNILEQQGGYPQITAAEGDDWLGDMIRAGAELGHLHYQTIIDHYNFHLGVKDPPQGLDQTLKDLLAEQIGVTVVGFARVLERLFDEADVEPPKSNVTLAGCLARLTMPIAWVTRKMSHRHDRQVVSAMYRELQVHGRVNRSIPADERMVRKLHAEEVLQVTVEELDQRPLNSVGQHHGEGTLPREVPRKPVVSIRREAPAKEAAPTKGKSSSKAAAPPARFYLQSADDVVDAPSIGPQTAKRLQPVGIRTVQDLLQCDPEAVAQKLRLRHVDAATITAWQQQARLVCSVSHMRGHDAQLLVACDISTPQQLAGAVIDDVLAAINILAKSRDGRRLLRGSSPPQREEVEGWIASARSARRAA